MNRLLSTLRLDVRLQWRNGFYYASLFVGVTMVIVLRSLFTHETLAQVIPYFLFLATSAGFYFIAGLVLLEKSEGTLEGVVVSPLRTREYLASKLLSLTGLGLAENLTIVVLSYGIEFSWIPLLLGAVLISLQYTLLGLILIARFDSITDFILPGVLFMTVLQLPIFSFIEKIPEWAFMPWPTYGPLVLFHGAFQPIAAHQTIYAVIYSVVSIAVFYHFAHQSFERFVVRKEALRV